MKINVKYLLGILIIVIIGVAALKFVSTTTDDPWSLTPYKILFIMPESEKTGNDVYADTIRGLRRAEKHFQASVDFLYTTTDIENFEAVDSKYIENVLDNNHYDLVIVLSGEYKYNALLLAPKYPKIKFAVLDDRLGDTYPNLLSVSFNLYETGFIGGVAAALFVQEANLPKPSITTDLDGIETDFGWVGGMNTRLFDEVFYGYRDGVHFISPNAVVTSSIIDSFSDKEKAENSAAAMFSNGAKVVMAYAGTAGAGVFKAARLFNQYSIGCDKDQDNEEPGYIITSIIKRFDRAAYFAVEHAINGSFYGTHTLTLGNGGLEYTGMFPIYKSLGNALPADFRQKLFLVKTAIVDGTIQLNYPEYYSRSTWR